MLQSNPSIAFFENFIKAIKKGINIGKLSIAIKEKLYCAFEEIAEVVVRITAKPIQPKTIENK